MTPPPATIVLTTLLFVAMCVACDLRSLRIPNLLTGPAILLGVALNCAHFGLGGIQSSITGFLLAVLLLFGPFALGGVGGGDVKMMGAVGALLGPRLALVSLAAGLVLGGIFAAIALARAARLGEKLLATWWMAANAVLAGSVEPLRATAADPNAVKLPYSLPLGLGTASVIAISMVAKQ